MSIGKETSYLFGIIHRSDDLDPGITTTFVPILGMEPPLVYSVHVADPDTLICTSDVFGFPREVILKQDEINGTNPPEPPRSFTERLLCKREAYFWEPDDASPIPDNETILKYAQSRRRMKLALA